MKYNVGIIGRGFVGGALTKYLSKQDSLSVVSYDLSDDIEMNQGYEKVVRSSDIIYVCVPTPPPQNPKKVPGILLPLAHAAEVTTFVDESYI